MDDQGRGHVEQYPKKKKKLIIDAVARSQRRFNFISMISFSSTMLVTWEALGSTFQAALENGGPVSLVYGFLLALVGTLALSASLAELESM